MPRSETWSVVVGTRMVFSNPVQLWKEQEELSSSCETTSSKWKCFLVTDGGYFRKPTFIGAVSAVRNNFMID